MTDTPKAVRLADELAQLAAEGASLIHLQSGAYICQKFAEAAALLRRIPELEADVQEQARLNGMGAERELALRAQVSRLEAERDQLRAELEKVRWQPIETAPKDGTLIVLRRDDAVHSGRWASGAFTEGWLSPSSDYVFAFSNIRPPTHWMPLPAAPTPPHADQKGQ